MATTYACRDVGMDCDWTASAASADELMAKCGEHAALVHPTVTLTPEVRTAVRAAFKAAFVAALFALALVAGVAGHAEAAKPGSLPGAACVGALNMLHDPTMFETMVAHLGEGHPGWDGMFRAVDVSACS
jgi:predicted small metal-binding protein